MSSSNKYGNFEVRAGIFMAFRNIVDDPQGPQKLSASAYTAVISICDQLSRLLAGDPEYHDTWSRIEAYAKLMCEVCPPKPDPRQVEMPLDPVMPEVYDYAGPMMAGSCWKHGAWSGARSGANAWTCPTCAKIEAEYRNSNRLPSGTIFPKQAAAELDPEDGA